LGEYPLLFFGFMRFAGNSRRRAIMVSSDTEFVVEGFPRSGNTFAVAAFLLAQQRPVKISHHLHVPAQIIYAARLNIPTLVLIRKPDEAILSMVIREPWITIQDALYLYCRFYDKILLYSSNYVVGAFEEIVNNFGNVTRRVNERFGVEFVPFEHTQSNLEQCFRLIEEMDKEDRSQSSVTETTVARPSPERDNLKKQLAERLQEKKMRVKLERAYDVYQKFLETSGINAP